MPAPLTAPRLFPDAAEAIYRTDLVHVRESSVSGTGAFAAGDVLAGTRLMPLTGTVVRRDQVDMDTIEVGILQIGDDKFLIAAGGPDDYINHSCDPNVAFTPDGMGYYALRDIQAGEEFLIDYATSEYDSGWKVTCLCGSSACRGVVTGFADLDEVTQQRLLPLALPYIRVKF